MTTLHLARCVGAGLLAVSVAANGIALDIEYPPNDAVPELVASIFEAVPPSDHMSFVIKDAPYRAYRAFYLSTYADVKELRAYLITFRNVEEYVADLGDIDSLIAAGNHAEVFDGIVGVMRLDLGSRYVSDVGLDGIHEGPVAVGMGSMRDRFHRQQFATPEDADKAYVGWLERAVALLASDG